jgi:hypothetical protein
VSNKYAICNSYLFLIFAKFVEKRIRTPCNCNFFPPKSLFKCIYLASEKIKSKSVKYLSPLNLMGVVAHNQLATEYRGVSKNLRNFYKIVFLQTFTDLISIFIYHFMTVRLAVICLHSFLGKIVPTFFHQNHYSNAYISQTKR